MRSLNKSAFTLVEMLVIIAIIGLLAIAAGVNFDITQRNARDSRRKQDVTAISHAVGLYVVANGNAAIKDTSNGKDCNLAGLANTQDINTPPTHPTANGCVGSNGRGYGLVNASIGTPPIVTLINNTSDTGTRSYQNNGTSISGALHNLGFLANIATDPKTKDAKDAGKGNADYILLRGCNDGRQNVSSGGSLYAVWTRLEGSASPADTNNSSAAIGGSKAVLLVTTLLGSPYTVGSPYAYDFASNHPGTYYNYAAGAAVSTAYLGSCSNPKSS